MSQPDPHAETFLWRARCIAQRLLDELQLADPAALADVRRTLGADVAPRLIVDVHAATVALAFTRGDLTVECVCADLDHPGGNADGIDAGIVA